MQKDIYSVEVIGFSDNEQTVLGSVFGLSARRTPKFARHAVSNGLPDIFLVDSDDEAAVRQLGVRNALGDIPVVLIGNSSCGTNWALLPRPIRWMKLFQAFDAAIETSPAVATPEPSETIAASAPPAVQQAQDFIRPNLVVPPKLAASVSAPPPAIASTMITEVFVPLAPVTPTAVPVARPAPATVGEVTARLRAAIDSATERVLVVDDNATVREFMRNKLAAFNFHVDYAESGEQAIGMTGQHNYSCVFLDVVMPGIDGYQVCKLIKANRSAKKTTVVMLTSKNSPFDKIRGAMSGCDAYLTKPVDEEKLIETIAKFLHTGN
jgi:twitching motility two-component system response regulator PilG